MSSVLNCYMTILKNIQDLLNKKIEDVIYKKVKLKHRESRLDEFYEKKRYFYLFSYIDKLIHN